MRTVTFEIADRASVNQRFISAMNGTPQGAFISLASPDLLFKILTAKRWELLQAMTGAN